MKFEGDDKKKDGYWWYTITPEGDPPIMGRTPARTKRAAEKKVQAMCDEFATRCGYGRSK